MRSSTVYIFLAFALLIPSAVARNYQGIPSEGLFDSRQKRYGHLEYVGFYGSAMRHWNFTEQLSDRTNLTWVEVGSIDTTVARIREAKQQGVKAVLSVQPFLFDAGYRVKSDYLYTLSRLQQLIENEGLTQHIAMIYPVDEPYLRAESSTLTNRERIYHELDTINGEIQTLFPGIPIGVIFNNKELLRKGFKIPPSYSWVGFDCYENLYDCKGKPFTDYYSTLLANMTPEQYLMAVPQAWARYRDYERENYEPRAFYEERIKAQAINQKRRLQQHYEIALSEPRFIAFIPFLWSLESAPGRPGNSGFGADKFPAMYPEGGQEFVDYLSKISREIKTASYSYPNLNLRQTEFSLYRPADKYDGEILAVSGNGLVSAWGVNWALPHKSLRMQLVVSLQGQEIYASSLRRSFVLDTELASRYSPDLPLMGVHGYRHRLPGEVRTQLEGKTARVELRIYGDRARAGEYHSLHRHIEF